MNMGKRIFIYLNDKEQVPLVYPMVSENTDIEYGIIIENLYKDDFIRLPIGKLYNIRLYEINALEVASLSVYGAFISTDTCIEKGTNALMILLNIFTTLQVPIFELQKNLVSPSSCCNINFATHHLNWYEKKQENSYTIGYPISANKQSVSNGEFILVITDFQDSYYIAKDIVTFYHSIYEYVRTHINANVIWKMSEEEINNAEIIRIQQNYKNFYTNELRRICLCNENSILERLPISELIAKANFVITTVTMSRFLDCELYDKPVAVYDKLNGITDTLNFKEVTVFHDAKELEDCIFDNPCKKMCSGLLFPYNNEAFLSAIEAHYKLCVTPSKQYIWSLVAISELLKTNASEVIKTNISNKTRQNQDNNTYQIKVLRKKYTKHLKTIRIMIIGLCIELLIIMGLLLYVIIC